MQVAAVSKINGEFPTLTARDIAPPKRLLRLQINRKDSVIISKLDLERSAARIQLNKINKVLIQEDVTDEMLKNHIESINGAELVQIPHSIPKLVALSLLNHCQKYEFY